MHVRFFLFFNRQLFFIPETAISNAMQHADAKRFGVARLATNN
jgi:hypothetical protein